VSRLVAFNHSRTTAEAEAAAALPEGWTLIDKIVSHRVNENGLLDFEVLWSNGVTSWHNADTINKIKKFKDYVHKHKITEAQLAPAASNKSSGRNKKKAK